MPTALDIAFFCFVFVPFVGCVLFDLVEGE
jgi:hypothetical protein